MWKRKAMLVSADALMSARPEDRTSQYRLLGDYRSRGYAVVLVMRPSEQVAASALLESEMRRTTGHGWTGVVVGNGDPAALWEAARRFDLDLGRSILVSNRGAHSAMARCAGVVRIVDWRDLESAVAMA